jgi:hypothetical protein
VADDEGGFEDTLEAYEHAKREQLATEGPEPLRRELASLTRFLDREDENPQLANVDVDVDFRRGKARVLREILAEAQTDDD